MVDASVLVELLLRTPKSLDIWQRVLDEDWHAPHLIDIEVAHALRRNAALNAIDDRAGRDALEHLAAFRIERYPHRSLMPRIWSLRDNMTAYDGAYVALAEIIEAPVVTCDRKLARSIGHQAKIEVI